MKFPSKKFKQNLFRAIPEDKNTFNLRDLTSILAVSGVFIKKIKRGGDKFDGCMVRDGKGGASTGPCSGIPSP